MQLISHIFYLVYVAMAITPMLIVFALRSEKVDLFVLNLDSLVFSVAILLIALLLSCSYIFFIRKINKNIQAETMKCSEIEIAEPKYIPIYIAYFVIALSIPKIEYNGWIVFLGCFCDDLFFDSKR